jgi:hypothetical protein
MVEIAQKIRPTPFTPVVCGDANYRYQQHDHADSHTQP